jgi:ankyrin repeat protein
MRAALEGQTESVKALLRKGADVNAKDGAGRTALMFAVINMHRETVKALLDCGADVNAGANDGGTALMFAASCGDADIVRALLKEGADVDGKFVQTNMTARRLALKQGHDEIVRLLGQAGAQK